MDRSGTCSVRFWPGSKRNISFTCCHRNLVCVRAVEWSFGSTSTPGLGNIEFLSMRRIIFDFASFLCAHKSVKIEVFEAVGCTGEAPVSLKTQEAVSSQAEPSLFSNNLMEGSYCHFNSNGE